jgi:hypothetical protein
MPPGAPWRPVLLLPRRNLISQTAIGENVVSRRPEETPRAYIKQKPLSLGFVLEAMGAQSLGLGPATYPANSSCCRNDGTWARLQACYLDHSSTYRWPRLSVYIHILPLFVHRRIWISTCLYFLCGSAVCVYAHPSSQLGMSLGAQSERWGHRPAKQEPGRQL